MRSAAILLLAATCAAQAEMEKLGGNWWIRNDPSNTIEAGRRPRALVRETGGRRVEVDDMIEKTQFQEPDCVIYQTARLQHRVFAVCGDRTPVAVASSSAVQWEFGPNGLERVVEPAVAGGRAVETVESLSMRDLIDLAMKQPPYREGWEAGEIALKPVRRERAVDVNASRPAGNSPLIDAVAKGRADLVDALLAGGADPNGRSGSGATALMIAAGRGDLAVVERLLAANAGVDLQDNAGATALMYAAGVAETAVVRRLRAAGADPRIRDKQGRTALDLVTSTNPELRELLKP